MKGLRFRGGAWEVRRTINGEARYARVGYTKEQRAKAVEAAEKKVVEWRDEANKMKPREDDAPVKSAAGITFGEWCDDYVPTYSSKKTKRVAAGDKRITDLWRTFTFDRKRTWNDVPLDEFDAIHCERALAQRRSLGSLNESHKEKRDIEESTVTRERVLIEAVFNSAIKNRKAKHNPWVLVDKAEAVSNAELVLEPAEEAKLREVFANTPPGHAQVKGGPLNYGGPRWDRYLTFVLETGVRLDESLKVTDDDLALKDGYLHVHGKGRKRLTKCPACKRMGGKCRNIPLSKLAKQTLAEQVASDGKYWDNTAARIREVLSDACVKAGVKHISPHVLRHTFGHRFLTKPGSNGWHSRLHVLSKVLGHSSITVTEKHYAYLKDSDIAREVLAVLDGDETAPTPPKKTKSKLTLVKSA